MYDVSLIFETFILFIYLLYICIHVINNLIQYMYMYDLSLDEGKHDT